MSEVEIPLRTSGQPLSGIRAPMLLWNDIEWWDFWEEIKFQNFIGLVRMSDGR